MRARVAYAGAVHEAKPAGTENRVRLADGRELGAEDGGERQAPLNGPCNGIYNESK